MNARSRHLVVVIIIAMLVVFHQNCSPYHSSVEYASNSALIDPFFNYTYATAADYFVNTQLLGARDSTTNKFRNLKFFAAVAKANGSSETLNYEVQLSDDNGFPICPVVRGQLIPTQSTILFDCVSPADLTKANVKIQLTDPQNQTYSLSATYL